MIEGGEELVHQPPTPTGQRFTPRRGHSLTLPYCVGLSWEWEMGVVVEAEIRHGGGDMEEAWHEGTCCQIESEGSWLQST